MKIKQAAGAAALCIVVAALGYFTFARDGVALPGLAAGDNDRLAQLERTQQAQYEALNEKIDQLADSIASNRSSSGAPARANFARAGDALRPRLSTQQIQARGQQLKASLDSQLQSQPVDPKWSMESTRIIERSLTPEGLKDVGAAPPAGMDVDCRASMCRIHLVYEDNASATDAGIALNLAIADRMPYTQVVTQQRPDGGVDHFIYATRNPSSRSLR